MVALLALLPEYVTILKPASVLAETVDDIVPFEFDVPAPPAFQAHAT